MLYQERSERIMAKISVIGAGILGTALAILLHGNGNQVTHLVGSAR